MPIARAKLVDVEYFPLTSPVDLINVLTFALTVGWRGSISVWPDPSDTTVDSQPIWQLTLDPIEQGTAHPIASGLGADTVIWDGTTLKLLNAEQFNISYSITTTDTAEEI